MSNAFLDCVDDKKERKESQNICEKITSEYKTIISKNEDLVGKVYCVFHRPSFKNNILFDEISFVPSNNVNSYDFLKKHFKGVFVAEKEIPVINQNVGLESVRNVMEEYKLKKYVLKN